MITNGVIAGLRMPDRPTDASAKRVAQTCEGVIRAHDEIGAVSRQSSIARRRGNGCCDETWFPGSRSKRKPAHEGCAEILARPKRFERRWRGVVNIFERNAGCPRHPVKQRPPRLTHPGR